MWAAIGGEREARVRMATYESRDSAPPPMFASPSHYCIAHGVLSWCLYALCEMESLSDVVFISLL